MRKDGALPEMTQAGLQAFLIKILPLISRAFMEEGLGIKTPDSEMSGSSFAFSEHAIVEAASAIMSSMALSAASGDHKDGSDLLIQMILAVFQRQQKMAAGTGQSMLFNSVTGESTLYNGMWSGRGQ